MNKTKQKYKIKLKSGATLLIEKLRKYDSYYSVLCDKTAYKSRGDYKRIGTFFDLNPILELFNDKGATIENETNPKQN